MNPLGSNGLLEEVMFVNYKELLTNIISTKSTTIVLHSMEENIIELIINQINRM